MAIGDLHWGVRLLSRPQTLVKGAGSVSRRGWKIDPDMAERSQPCGVVLFRCLAVYCTKYSAHPRVYPKSGWRSWITSFLIALCVSKLAIFGIYARRGNAPAITLIQSQNACSV